MGDTHSPNKNTCIAGYIIGENVYDGLLPREKNLELKKVRKAQPNEYYKYCQNLVLLNEFCKEHNLTLIPYSTLQNQNFRLGRIITIRKF